MVRVRLFASLAEAAGGSCLTLEIGAQADISELWSLLQEQHPALREIRYAPLAVCDLEYARWERRLEGIAEVAFLPPVSGG